MAIDYKIRAQICNMILREKQQKYRHYHSEKLIIMNILQAKKYCHLIKAEQAKFACSPLAKAFKKQTKTIAKTIEEQGQKQVKALEVLKSD